MDLQKFEDRLIYIEAMLDVLLTLEIERHLHEGDRPLPDKPFEHARFPVDELLRNALAAAADRSRRT